MYPTHICSASPLNLKDLASRNVDSILGRSLGQDLPMDGINSPSPCMYARNYRAPAISRPTYLLLDRDLALSWQLIITFAAVNALKTGLPLNR